MISPSKYNGINFSDNFTRESETFNFDNQRKKNVISKDGFEFLSFYSDSVLKPVVAKLILRQSKYGQAGIPQATTLHPRWNDSGDATIFGTDRFGLNLLPAGKRRVGLGYVNIGQYFQTHCSDAIDSVNSYQRALYSQFGYLYNGIDDNYKATGLSIRSVRTATTEEQLLPDGLISATYTDIDGNIYQCTKIGLQVWTTTNLKVTKYADGSTIPTNLSNVAWAADTDGACAVYGKAAGAYVPTDELATEADMVAAYGRLYNWYAVTNVKGLITAGTELWHVPTDAEFTQLTDYLIATYPEITSDNVGDVLKSTRQVNSPYIIEFGFNEFVEKEIIPFHTLALTVGWVYFFKVLSTDIDYEAETSMKVVIDSETIYSEIYSVKSASYLTENEICELTAYNSDFRHGYLDVTYPAFGFFRFSKLNSDIFLNKKVEYEYSYGRKKILSSENNIAKRFTFLDLTMYQQNLLKWLCNTENLFIDGIQYQLISDFTELLADENTELKDLRADFIEVDQSFFGKASTDMPNNIFINNFFM